MESRQSNWEKNKLWKPREKGYDIRRMITALTSIDHDSPCAAEPTTIADKLIYDSIFVTASEESSPLTNAPSAISSPPTVTDSQEHHDVLASISATDISFSNQIRMIIFPM